MGIRSLGLVKTPLASLARLRKHPVLKSVGQLVIGSSVTTVITFVAGLLIARWISPERMGLWNAVSLVSVYGPYITLGVFNGLNRELPFLIGQGRQEEAHRVASASYAWAIVLAALTLPATLLWSGSHLLAGRQLQAVASFGVGVGVLLSWPGMYLNTTYRTHAEFARLAINSAVVAALGLLLVALVRLYDFNGLVVRAILVSGLSLAVLYYRKPLSVRPRWSTRRMIQLVKVGFPIYMVGQLYSFFASLDRLVLVGHTQTLGYYTLAIQVGAAVRMLPGSFNTVVYPRMAHRYGETGRAADLWRMGLRSAAAATLLGAGIGVLSWIGVPPLVRWFLPRYAPGIPAAQWASLLGMAMGFYPLAQIFNVIKRQDLYAAGWGVGLALFLVVFLLLARSNELTRATSSAQAMLAGTLSSNLVWTILAKYACVAHDRRLDRRIDEGPDAPH